MLENRKIPALSVIFIVSIIYLIAFLTGFYFNEISAKKEQFKLHSFIETKLESLESFCDFQFDNGKAYVQIGTTDDFIIEEFPFCRESDNNTGVV